MSRACYAFRCFAAGGAVTLLVARRWPADPHNGGSWVAMDNLFGKGLSAYPSSWSPSSNPPGLLELGGYVEVAGGPYAELRGVVTYLERDYAWVRLDGDAYDLRFRRDLLRTME